MFRISRSVLIRQNKWFHWRNEDYSRKAESAGPNTSSIPIDLLRFNEARYLSRYLSIYQAAGFQNIAFNVLILLAICFKVWVKLVGIGEGI